MTIGYALMIFFIGLPTFGMLALAGRVSCKRMCRKAYKDGFMNCGLTMLLAEPAKGIAS